MINSTERPNTEPVDHYIDLFTDKLVEAIKDPHSEIADKISRILSSTQGRRVHGKPRTLLEAIEDLDGTDGEVYKLINKVGLQLDITLRLLDPTDPNIGFINKVGFAGMYGQDISRIFGQKIGTKGIKD